MTTEFGQLEVLRERKDVCFESLISLHHGCDGFTIVGNKASCPTHKVQAEGNPLRIVPLVPPQKGVMARLRSMLPF
jgi:hypothetical protein